MPPHFWSDLGPFRWLILFAFIDPVVIAIGLWMGWHANQAGKVILAGFAAGLAGTAMSFLAHQFGASWFEGGYMFGGAHALFRFLAGIAWAVVGYSARTLRARR